MLKVDYLDYDCKHVAWVKDHTIRLTPFGGAKLIWDLPYIPLNLGPEPEMIRGILVENGKSALRRHGRQLVEYGGPALKKIEDRWVKFNACMICLPSDPAGLANEVLPPQPHGRVMLDPETWERIDPSGHAVPNIRRVSLESVKEDDEKVMLLNSFVYGYSLGDKTLGMSFESISVLLMMLTFFPLGKFSVTKTSDAKWSDGAFSKLVSDEEVKSFVHELVSEHRARVNKAFDDIVHDKGKGLVGPLGGVPGVGKASRKGE